MALIGGKRKVAYFWTYIGIDSLKMDTYLLTFGNILPWLNIKN